MLNASFLDELLKEAVDTRTLFKLRKLPRVDMDSIDALFLGGGAAYNVRNVNRAVAPMEKFVRQRDALLSKTPRGLRGLVERGTDGMYAPIRSFVDASKSRGGYVGVSPPALVNTVKAMGKVQTTRPAVRGALIGAGISHELSEAGAKSLYPQKIVSRYGHVGPSVLLKEHNMLSRLTGPGSEQARNMVRVTRQTTGDTQYINELVRRTTGERGTQFLQEGRKVPKAMRKHIDRRVAETPDIAIPSRTWLLRDKLRRKIQ